jgi:hypothetical protein
LPIAPVLFNIHIDIASEGIVKRMKQNVLIKNIVLNKIFFAGEGTVTTTRRGQHRN